MSVAAKPRQRHLRGTWLLNAASDARIDEPAGTLSQELGPWSMTAKTWGLSLTQVEQQWWKTLCGDTHTGFQHICVRLTSEGLGSDDKDEEVEMARKMSSNISLVTVMQFAALASDESLAKAALDRMTSLADATAAA